VSYRGSRGAAAAVVSLSLSTHLGKTQRRNLQGPRRSWERESREAVDGSRVGEDGSRSWRRGGGCAADDRDQREGCLACRVGETQETGEAVATHQWVRFIEDGMVLEGGWKVLEGGGRLGKVLGRFWKVCWAGVRTGGRTGRGGAAARRSGTRGSSHRVEGEFGAGNQVEAGVAGWHLGSSKVVKGAEPAVPSTFGS